MVDDMLNISYLDSENATFQMQPADLAGITRNLVDEVKASDSMGHKAIEFSAEPESVTVQGNATQLSRAIQGVLMNAVQYTSDEGQIQVRVSVADGLARVDIQDNGIGIHAKDLPHIFDHFYRSDSARPVKTGGAGVGLTISRKIIEMHGGQITVESQPGVGSTFHLLLPLRQVFANAILAD
jgi:signal transduction histidine kinase